MSNEYIEKVNRDRNKAYVHITDEVESFIYKKGIINSYDIETFSDTDIEKGKVSDQLTITINMSRDI